MSTPSAEHRHEYLSSARQPPGANQHALPGVAYDFCIGRRATILDDAMPNHVTLFDLAVDPPAQWEEQRARVG